MQPHPCHLSLTSQGVFLPSGHLGASTAHALKRRTGQAGLFPEMLLFLLAGAMALFYVVLDFKAPFCPCSRFLLPVDLNWSPASWLFSLAPNVDSLVL